MHRYNITRIQQITILAHMQIITMRSLSRDCTFFHLLCLMLFSTYYVQNYVGIIGADLKTSCANLFHPWVANSTYVVKMC